MPQGFVKVQITNGFTNPTAMAVAPDGRIFVTQQNGFVRVIKNGALLATPFLQIQVKAVSDRGLLGIALDPGFSTNQYIYLYYTLPDGSRNRISRFTGNGDIAVPGSEVVVLNLDLIGTGTGHSGGAMHFGSDGKLYVSVGDNHNSNNAQNLDTYHGKLLRINKDGSIPTGNPFSGSPQKSRIWAYGLRNPYTLDIQPGTGRIFVNDVGEDAWEEINDATSRGKNFGWPLAEGNSANTALTNPVYSYAHGSGDGVGCSISGGAFFNPASTNYPSEYWGDYFFIDYCNQWINVLNLSGSTASRVPFATNLGDGLVYLDVGKDGNLYFLQRSTSSLYKIIYTNNTSPAIVKQPANQTVSEGQPANFSVTATGSAPLRYQWQKNGTNITNATSSSYSISSTKASDAGTYRVIVLNGYGSVASNSAQLTVTAFNNAPVATISTPAAGTLYRGGDTLRFSGSATDAEDGTLPASAFSWSVDFHHDTHVHDGPPVVQGAKSGYYVIPRTGEVSDNVWYRVILTVTDSKGLKNTTYRDVHPRKSTLTFQTQPAGLKLSLDGQPKSTPTSVSSVEGIQRTIGPVTPQTSGIKIYDFDRWLHGGSATQKIITPENNTTYTAAYKQSPFSPTKFETENALLTGVVISSAHPGYTGSGFVDYINASGDQIEWIVNVATAGSYEISFRYALAQGTRNLQIQVNGTTINAALAFSATGNWSSWSNMNISANLNAGTNRIKAIATGTSGPNVDFIVLTPQTLQAENAIVFGPSVKSNVSGSTGTGFVDYTNSTSDFIEWIVYRTTVGSVLLSFRYANGSSANRPLQLTVNGVVVSSNLAFPPTGSWFQWSNATASTYLSSGMNRVRLTAIGSSGANIDYLKWSSNTSSAAMQSRAVAENINTDNQTIEQGLSVIASPNPATEMVRLQINKRPDLPVKISIVNASGKVYKRLLIKSAASGNLNLSVKGLPLGLYVVIVEQGNKRVSTKLIID